MIKILLITGAFSLAGILYAQPVIRPLKDLINTKDPGWPFVQDMIRKATNQVTVLPCDTARANAALLNTQVTTRSPMGAVIYNTGGILVDHGWIRILGSGSKQLERSLPDWNKGKSYREFGELPAYTLIADDAVGGFFAINGGGLGSDKGQTYYLSPDRLVWEPLHMTYTAFLGFCFNDSLSNFYAGLRWTNWQQDITSLATHQVFNFYPYLWTTAGKEVNKNKRKKIPAEKQFKFNMEARKKLGLETPPVPTT